MARILALDITESDARLVAASARVGGATVEAMIRVALPSGEGATPEARGAALAAALAERRVARGAALVVLGRAQVELKQLTLPPSPDTELPDMVRLQGLREFTSLSDDWPLDFVPLGHDATQPREVLAAAVSPEVMAALRATCGAAGLEASRVGLRPMAAASLFLRGREANRYSVRLLIDLLPGEADLTVIADKHVVFTRNARLGSHGSPIPSEEPSADKAKVAESTTASSKTPASHAALVGQIRRTLAAVHSQLKDRRVEVVYVWGVSPPIQALARQIEKEIDLPCQTLDPLAEMTLARELRDTPPESPERFAALLGLIADEAESITPAVDFLHPRQAPPPPSRRR